MGRQTLILYKLITNTMSNISLLLGAGFSVNKGYPTANQLNQKITSLTGKEFTGLNRLLTSAIGSITFHLPITGS